MTIIQPNRTTSYKANFLILILMFTAISIAIWGVFLYNQLVNIRHDIKSQQNSLSKAEVTNAELKNSLYTIIDAKNLQSLNNSQSLVLDKNPEYVKLTKDRQLTTQN